VRYFQTLRPGRKVALMGHSTGCQDALEYLVGQGGEERAQVAGVILQGGVSDREAWTEMLGSATEKQELGALLSEARRMIDAGNEDGFLNLPGNAVAKELGAVSAYRAWSLLAPGGDDDFFSSDLSDAQLASTFGRIGTKAKVCFLLGSLDPYVPARIDKAGLLGRWTRIIREGGGQVDEVNGGVVQGAHHNLDGDPEEVVTDLVCRVVRFLAGLEE
jgi:pimeloyl-ACP methyl ester carboxylesterase